MTTITYLAASVACFMASLLCEVFERKKRPHDWYPDRNKLRASGFFFGWGVLALALFINGFVDWMML